MNIQQDGAKIPKGLSSIKLRLKKQHNQHLSVAKNLFQRVISMDKYRVQIQKMKAKAKGYLMIYAGGESKKTNQ
jgi:hypothetical protein